MIKIKANKKIPWLMLSYGFLFLLYALFSYVFTDPNLILIKADWFMAWQNFLWQKVLPHTDWRAGIFLGLIVLLIINYYLLIKYWCRHPEELKKNFLLYLLSLIAILFFSYNTLSHDIFNYIFNARMVLKYQVDPHQTVALNFQGDPWLRFMHNTHTAAPYGQLWTVISLLPYLLGWGKFVLTWLGFRSLSVLAFLLSFLFLARLQKNRNKLNLAILFFNPLVLIETISNAHNDWWMMWPVLASFALLTNKSKKTQPALKIIFIIILMSLSIFIKYASILCIPFLLYFSLQTDLNKLLINEQKIFKKIKKFLDQYFWDLLSLSLFLPLLTSRSQRFLTWYLIWPIAFLPLLKSSWWRKNLLIFSSSALLSYLPSLVYLPWLTFDQNTPDLLFLKQLILWLPVLIYNLLFLLQLMFNKLIKKK